MSAYLRTVLAIALAATLAFSGCSSTQGNSLDPKAIETKYGLSGGYVEKISTENGMVDATIIPTTLKDGRKVQWVIPHQPVDPDHQVFMREGITITPVELSDPSMAKKDFVASEPRVVERRTVTAPAPAASAATAPAKRKRSLEKEVLIVGGGAGAGAAIGAAAGGGKGAAVGALSGGVAGLVYDLATRNKK
jgi:hypothetical protein